VTDDDFRRKVSLLLFPFAKTMPSNSEMLAELRRRLASGSKLWMSIKNASDAFESETGMR
jgi:hypothetical protein